MLRTLKIEDTAVFLKKYHGIPLTCPECRRDFTDDTNKLRIGMHRACVECVRVIVKKHNLKQP